MAGPEPAPWILLGRTGDRTIGVELDDALQELRRERIDDARLAEWVAARERAGTPRWVWADTVTWYPRLLDAGVRVARVRDLRLSRSILRSAASVRAQDRSSDPRWTHALTATDSTPALFELDDDQTPDGPDDLLLEVRAQEEAVSGAEAPGGLRMLLAAESAGALIAAEMHAAGLPWDAREHDRILREHLGPRTRDGSPPARVAAAAQRVRAELGDPSARVDSPPQLLRALHRVGVQVSSTNRWELAEQDHPVVSPLIEYKRLSRLLSANGWNWLDEWVHEGRFRPVYVPGGVVTGRWASSGGGALQIPRMLRPAVRADEGWALVVADVAQLEPRILAALSGDESLAAAGRGRDLYTGIVESGVVATRTEAKIALLGAMYGSTTGDSARLLPQLRRAYPRAMRLVDDAAAIGESGGVVSTRLGRTSPAASEGWRAVQQRAAEVAATGAEEKRARQVARDRGRFTRNFVVQGTAAEWALIWLADLRARLAEVPGVPPERAAPRSGPLFATRPHLAFFLHDEIIVHTPQEHADVVAEAIRASATAAGRMLFGEIPVDFPLDLRIGQSGVKE